MNLIDAIRGRVRRPSVPAEDVARMEGEIARDSVARALGNSHRIKETLTELSVSEDSIADLMNEVDKKRTGTPEQIQIRDVAISSSLDHEVYKINMIFGAIAEAITSNAFLPGTIPELVEIVEASLQKIREQEAKLRDRPEGNLGFWKKTFLEELRERADTYEKLGALAKARAQEEPSPSRPEYKSFGYKGAQDRIEAASRAMGEGREITFTPVNRGG